MELNNIHSVYFLGIGGIGMSALARYFNTQGKQVFGYDKTPTALTKELESEGIKVNYTDDISFFQALNTQYSVLNTLIIYTPAIPKDHSEFNWFKDNGYTVLKRSQVLGLLTQQNHTIAVAGTHGKTTTSSIIAHVLKSAGLDISAFLGGITKNYNTNLILPERNQAETQNSQLRTRNYVVVEADEYDRSFLTLYPDITVVTSMDADHLDIYGDITHMHDSYREFVGQIKDGGLLVTKPELDLRPKAETRTYTVNTTGDYTVHGIRIINHQYVFDVDTPTGVLKGLTIGLPGLHNVENACAAIAVAQKLNISESDIRKALESYTGVKRRFDYQLKSPAITYIDDYAHHPEELRACIQSVKTMYTGKKITGIFQPHLYSRTRDFVDGFAESLSLLDELILLDIYAAREKPIEGITSQIIYDRVTTKKMLTTKPELMQVLEGKSIEVLLTLGAGDIDTFVGPIKEMLQKKLLANSQ